MRSDSEAPLGVSAENAKVASVKVALDIECEKVPDNHPRAMTRFVLFKVLSRPASLHKRSCVGATRSPKILTGLRTHNCNYASERRLEGTSFFSTYENECSK